MKKIILSIVLCITISGIFADDELMTGFNTSTTRSFIQLLLFSPTSVQIPESYYPYLDRVILQMINEPTLNLYLTAYSTNTGNAELAGSLCEQRLNMIKAYISDKSVASYRVICINKNFQKLPSPASIPEAEKRNNCIEFQFQ